jgi:mono/diheme cytochrome c family protein
MNTLFWQRMHGGATHFPIVLLLASVIFDSVAWRSRDESLRRGLHLAGLGSAVVGVLGGFGAVISGLVMTRGQMLGTGYEKLHHLFVWPAFGLCVAFVAWRLFSRGTIPPLGRATYLAGMTLAAALITGAGYWGGEMLLGAETKPIPAPASIASGAETAMVDSGHQLFLLNCAHCHGQDATGDECPNLHGVKKSDARITAMIKNGVKGEMPKFGSKLTDADVHALIAFIRSLK